MEQQLHVYLSNRLEELYIKFKENLFANGSPPFARRLVVVPSPALKSWLMLQLANDPAVGIAAGLEISYLDQTVHQLKELLGANNSSAKLLPNAMELSLTIEWELKNILLNDLHQKDEIWQPLLSYLHISPQTTLTRKSEKRLIALSEKLASLFLEYGKYGGQAVAEWEERPAQNWQEKLWKKIFGKEASWTYLYLELKNSSLPPNKRSNLPSIHLFSISFLPKLYYRFFGTLAASMEVNHYLLSPCQLFWSDVRSDREAARLLRYWKNKGVSSEQQTALETYMKDCNPLLANFGRLGREMAQHIEESATATHEDYALPASLLDKKPYDCLIDPETKMLTSSTLTLLQAIQADVVLLRNPTEGIKVKFESFDKTIQIHAAPTRLREVQVLYDNLLHLIDSHSQTDDPIKPSDIIVMAPAIMEYEPFIKMCFAREGSLLDTQIMDLHMPSQNPLVQGFLHLLSLPFTRWDSVSLLQLFHQPAFQKKQRISAEDFSTIERWIKENGINWGQNSRHRDELLSRDHCKQGMVDNSPVGTWEFGLERLLAGLIFYDSPDANLPIAPYEDIDFSQGELVGKVISLLRSLHEELRPLADGTLMTLAEWTKLLQSLLDTYFETTADEKNEQLDLNSHIDAFREAAASLPTALFSFISIRKHLEAALSRQTALYHESHLSAVRFCSLVPMRTIPAKVVVLIGMSEGAFPREDQKLSLNLIASNPLADFSPSQTDFDRYLFLEALLSARAYFIMSYINYSQDSKEQPASLLLSELMNYIDNAYEITEGIPSQLCQFKHAFNAFDKMYFANDSLYPSYSREEYKNACAYYPLTKKSSHNFIPQFIPPLPANVEKEMKINLRDLTSFAGNPLKTYFNSTLGIYLENEEERQLESIEKFQLNHLARDELKKSALKNPLPLVLQNTEKRGKLPLGIFKELAKDQAIQDVQKLKENIGGSGADPENLFEIEFSELYTEPILTEKGHWHLPPLQINHKDQIPITLVGIFRDVSRKGLVLHRKADKTDLVKVFPQILIFQSLVKTYSLPIELQYIFSKDGVIHPPFTDDPYPALEKYLDYYFNGKENASPLIPEWVQYFMTSGAQNIQDRLMETLKGPHSLNNPYIRWIMRPGCFPSIEEKIEQWKSLAESLYGDIYQCWVTKQRSKNDK